MESVASTETTGVGQRTVDLLTLLDKALSTRSQPSWSSWLQGEIQSYLPHDALVAAWGAFPTRQIAFEAVTKTPDPLADSFPKDVIEPLLSTLFQKWLDAGQTPVAVDTRPLRSVGCMLFATSPCALVHGVQDRRNRSDCLYLFAGPESLASAASRQACRMALPYIDIAFRQVAAREPDDAQPQRGKPGCGMNSYAACPFAERVGRTAAPQVPARMSGAAGESAGALSDRELEVMKWVRMGKTNAEIAMILHLSTFTVKNHMRRIYKKLDVLNRAQAVSNLERTYPQYPLARG